MFLSRVILFYTLIDTSKGQGLHLDSLSDIHTKAYTSTRFPTYILTETKLRYLSKKMHIPCKLVFLYPKLI
jgi:hypothetical protein